jgi:ABC-2 type transport system permease protein
MSLFLLQLQGEFIKLFARKRTYIGFGVFITIEIALILLFNMPVVQKKLQQVISRSGYAADEYLSGLTLALLVLVWSVFLLASLYLALVSGDLVSKESEDGTLRMMLCRPISRARILLLKAMVCLGYTLILVVFIAVSALAAGLLYGGAGGLFVFAPAEGVFALYEFADGLTRYAIAIPCLALSLFTISAIGFFFSCMNIKPAAATILTLSIFLVDTILKNVPYFEDIRGWFITAKMNAWLSVFKYQVPWESMVADYTWLMAINLTLFVLAWMMFESRDFKS